MVRRSSRLQSQTPNPQPTAEKETQESDQGGGWNAILAEKSLSPEPSSVLLDDIPAGGPSRPQSRTPNSQPTTEKKSRESNEDGGWGMILAEKSPSLEPSSILLDNIPAGGSSRSQSRTPDSQPTTEKKSRESNEDGGWGMILAEKSPSLGLSSIPLDSTKVRQYSRPQAQTPNPRPILQKTTEESDRDGGWDTIPAKRSSSHRPPSIPLGSIPVRRSSRLQSWTPDPRPILDEETQELDQGGGWNGKLVERSLKDESGGQLEELGLQMKLLNMEMAIEPPRN